MLYETSYPNLLGGVSQQPSAQRLPGQVTAQVNMLSDIVRGLCRRPPVQQVAQLPANDAMGGAYQPYAYHTATLNGTDVLLRMNPNGWSGYPALRVSNAQTGVDAPVSLTSRAITYITAAGNSPWRSTSIGEEVILWSPAVTPSYVTDTSVTYSDPKYSGYFYIPLGAYSVMYEVTLQIRGGGAYTAQYKTPDGTGGPDAGHTTPAYIASQLVTNLGTVLAAAFGPSWTSSWHIYSLDGYVFISYGGGSSGLEIATGTSELYVQVSGFHFVKRTADLPAKLPSAAQDFIMQVGSTETAAYYRYDYNTSRWLEDAAYGHYDVIQNLGIRLKVVTGVVYGDILDSDRRTAGTQTTNPAFNCSSRITGLSSYQGRLVLLSGQYVCMSAPMRPEVWFRTTMTGLTDSDPIEIASNTEFGADYKFAVDFNGDLLVTSSRAQSMVIGSAAITSRNANIGIVSQYNLSTEIGPVLNGRTVLLPFDRQAQFLGLLEAVPPSDTDQGLNGTDICAQIPQYIPAPAGVITTSTTADIVVVLPKTRSAGEPVYSIYVHQYLWNATEKVQAAWHKWTFKYPIRYIYFLSDVLYIVYFANAREHLGKVNLGRGDAPQHYLDFAYPVTVTAAPTVPAGTIPWTTAYAFKLTGANAGIGEYLSSHNFADAVNGDTYVVGDVFESYVQPSSPIIKDRSGLPLLNIKVPLVGFKGQVYNSGAIQAQVQDRSYDSGVFDCPILGLFQPAELATGVLKGAGTIQIPARTQAQDTVLTLKTSDYYDMNIESLEYSFKLNFKHKRA